MAESHAGFLRDETFATMIAVGIVACQWWIMDDLKVPMKWAVPGIATAFVIGLLVARLISGQPHRTGRALGIGLGWVLVVANVVDLVALCGQAFFGSPSGPTELLFTGAILWIMNVLVFGLVYWVLDAGGPQARATGAPEERDWVFPQQTDDRNSSPAWKPLVGDYLYLAFTGAIAFGPTDAMPYTRRAKALMAIEGALALATLGVIIARGVSLAGS